MARAPPAPGLSQEAESLSVEVQGIMIQTKSLHLGSLSSYDMKEAKIKVEANVFCKSESDLSCFTDSALQKKYIFLLDFQVEARCSYVRPDLSNNAWKGSVYQKGTFEDFRALHFAVPQGWVGGRPLGAGPSSAGSRGCSPPSSWGRPSLSSGSIILCTENR